MTRNAELVGISPMTFQAHDDYVLGILDLKSANLEAIPATIGLRFLSPEHLLSVFGEMMEQAAMVWPNHPLILSYLEDGSNEMDS